MKNDLKNLITSTYLISGLIFGGLIGFVATESIIGTFLGIVIGFIFGALFVKITAKS